MWKQSGRSNDRFWENREAVTKDYSGPIVTSNANAICALNRHSRFPKAVIQAGGSGRSESELLNSYPPVVGQLSANVIAPFACVFYDFFVSDREPFRDLG